MTAGPHEDAWSRVCDVLGIAPDLQAGDRVQTSGDGVPELGGTIDGTRRGEPASNYRFVVDAPAPGTGFIAAEGAGDAVAVSVYLYLYDGDPTAVADRWSTFLTQRLSPTSS